MIVIRQRFLYESLTLFGGVKDSLLKLATELLEELSSEPALDSKPKVNAEQFAKRAKSGN